MVYTSIDSPQLSDSETESSTSISGCLSHVLRMRPYLSMHSSTSPSHAFMCTCTRLASLLCLDHASGLDFRANNNLPQPSLVLGVVEDCYILSTLLTVPSFVSTVFGTVSFLYTSYFTFNDLNS